jgi:hypothetical protein
MNRVHSHVSYALHGDMNTTGHIGILPSYYLHRYIKWPCGLSCWFRIRALNTVLLN